MIPSTIAGLALFVVLLAPGLAYVLRHERVQPAHAHSPFREALRVIFVSVACLLAAGSLMAMARWLFPNRTPNFRGLVLDPADFFRGHHVQVIWWALLYVLTATAIGAAAADPRIVGVIRAVRQWRLARAIAGSSHVRIGSTSAWYAVFHAYDDQIAGPIMVGVQLNDGTYVSGQLRQFNVSATEDSDRELVLTSPRVKFVNGDEHPIEAQFTVLSARNIVRMDVTHIAPGAMLGSDIPAQDQKRVRTVDHATGNDLVT